jgi:hypothetical protein
MRYRRRASEVIEMPRANEPSSEEPSPALPISPSRINATRRIVCTLGVLFAIGGIDHGLFETLQGNTPTAGLFIHSIGPRQQMWPYGTEDAFTLIPNFLLSGIVSIALSLLIAVWSIRFVHGKHGSAIFLLLFILLFLSGGGVAQVVFFTVAWAVSLRIGKPPAWPMLLRQPARAAHGKLWLPCLVLFTVQSLAAFEIAIAGYVPGIQNPNLKQHICWSLLVLGLGVLLVSIASGFVYDAEQRS